MASTPRFRLVLQLPDGSRLEHPLGAGRRYLGRAAACEIRLPESVHGVAPFQAEVVVDGDAVTLINLGPAGSLRVGDAPVVGSRVVAEHDPIRFGSVVGTIVRVRGGGSDAVPTDAPVDVRERTSSDVRRGVGGYTAMRDRLATVIDADEAAAASTEFGRLTRLAVAALVFWAAALALITMRPHELLIEIAGSSALLAMLVLGSRWGVRSAGRLVCGAAAVFQAGAAVFASEVPGAPLREAGGWIASFLALGLLFDYGIGARRHRDDECRRRWALTGFGAVVLVAEGSLYRDGAAFWPPSVSAMAVLTMVWPWTVAPRLEARRIRDLAPDALTLVQLASLRWGRHLVGRALALGLFVFLRGPSPRCASTCPTTTWGSTSWR